MERGNPITIQISLPFPFILQLSAYVVKLLTTSYIYMCVHIYIYIHIHTHIHTHITNPITVLWPRRHTSVKELKGRRTRCQFCRLLLAPDPPSFHVVALLCCLKKIPPVTLSEHVGHQRPLLVPVHLRVPHPPGAGRALAAHRTLRSGVSLQLLWSVAHPSGLRSIC